MNTELMTLAQDICIDACSKQANAIKNLVGLPPDVFQRILLNAIVANPVLAQCSQQSLYQAIYDCAQFGFLPDGKAGALVPLRIKGQLEAQFWPMIDGYLAKARQAMPKTAFQAHVVFEDDDFEDIRGSSPILRHIPDPEADRRDENVFAVYATAHMPDNPIPEIDVMYRAEILEYRAYSRSERGPWASHFKQRARTAVFKRLLKRMPTAASLAGMMQLGEDTPEDEGDPADDARDITAEAEQIPPEETQPKKPPPQRRRRTRRAQQQEEPPPPAEPEESQETMPVDEGGEPDDVIPVDDHGDDDQGADAGQQPDDGQPPDDGGQGELGYKPVKGSPF